MMTNNVPGFPDDISIPKAQAKRLRSALLDRIDLSHAQSLELVSRLHGVESWGHLRAVLERGGYPPMSEPAVTAKGPGHHAFLERVTLRDLLDAVAALHFGQSRAAQLLIRIFETENLSGPFPRLEWGWLSERIDRPHEEYGLDPVPMEVRNQVSTTIFNAFDWLSRQINAPRYDWRPGEIELILSEMIKADAAPATKRGLFHGLRRVELPKPPAWGDLARGIHATLLTADLEATIASIRDNGLQVHDLSEAKDWLRLLRFYGMPEAVTGFARGPTGLAHIVGRSLGLSMSEPSIVMRRPAQKEFVILSQSELLTSGCANVLLAQARSLGMVILVHMDMGPPSGLDKAAAKRMADLRRHLPSEAVHVPNREPYLRILRPV